MATLKAWRRERSWARHRPQVRPLMDVAAVGNTFSEMLQHPASKNHPHHISRQPGHRGRHRSAGLQFGASVSRPAQVQLIGSLQFMFPRVATERNGAPGLGTLQRSDKWLRNQRGGLWRDINVTKEQKRGES